MIQTDNEKNNEKKESLIKNKIRKKYNKDENVALIQC
jgi:hypothetical protein